MILNWFKVFNKDAFDALGLVSHSDTFIFKDIGSVTVTLFKGNYYGVVIDNVFLCLNMNSKNPFVFEDRGIYIDGNNDIWVGYAP